MFVYPTNKSHSLMSSQAVVCSTFFVVQIWRLAINLRTRLGLFIAQNSFITLMQFLLYTSKWAVRSLFSRVIFRTVIALSRLSRQFKLFKYFSAKVESLPVKHSIVLEIISRPTLESISVFSAARRCVSVAILVLILLSWFGCWDWRLSLFVNVSFTAVEVFWYKKQ